jgi:hypothetical protein
LYFFHYLLGFWLLFERKEPIDYPLLDILKFLRPASQPSQWRSRQHPNTLKHGWPTYEVSGYASDLSGSTLA